MAVSKTRDERAGWLRDHLEGRAVLSGTGQPGAVESRLLLGVLLRGAARQEAGLELSEFEARMVDSLEHWLDREEVDSFGRIYSEVAEKRGLAGVFPQAVTGLALAEPYTEETFRKDLAQVPDMSQRSDVQVVDLAKGGQDAIAAPNERGGSRYSTTIVTSSDAVPAAAPGPTRIQARRLECVQDTDEATSDEIYFAVATASDLGHKRQVRTQEYGSFDTGDNRHISSDPFFDGRYNKTITLSIAAWEADDSGSGFYNEMDKKLPLIADALWNAAVALEPYPVGQWESLAEWIKVGSMITTIINWLIDALRNDDDFIEERTIVLDHAAIEKYKRDANLSWWWFRGDGARYRFYLNVWDPS
ncbi:hypothetical protein ACIQWN_36810 [Streptomyces vinaceus]|uniref:hypothetical protein n=1 Tax=Streptomyces vinaceus TaxID=1960 RepID=UPI00382EBFA5